MHVNNLIAVRFPYPLKPSLSKEYFSINPYRSLYFVGTRYIDFFRLYLEADITLDSDQKGCFVAKSRLVKQ